MFKAIIEIAADVFTDPLALISIGLLILACA
jgi:hypothetical protein